MEDNNFITDIEYFNIHFKPVCDHKGINAKRLLQFKIALPFFLPVNERTIFSFLHEDNNSKALIAFNIESFTRMEQVVTTSLEHAITLPKRYSFVEVAYITSEEHNFESDWKSQVFEMAFKKLNDLIVSFLIVTKYSSIYRVNLAMLEPTTLMRLLSIPDGNVLNEALYMLNMNVPTDENLINEEQSSLIAWYTHNVVGKEINPFITAEELMLSSFRLRDSGAYKEAVMLAQASVESFLRSIHKCCLIEEGKSAQEIENILEDTPFISLIRRELPQKIGGNWSQTSGVIADYLENTYKVRNRTAHGGFNPGYDDTQQAIIAANAVRHHVLSILKAKPSSFQFLLKYFESPRLPK
ncbi:hypothetical protein ACFSO0_02535 [Brevibacillus sp. GCM10020057]|uniref:hypothetical protein n=1 Tax=Brevibacillus sp. GCM10020057 TaxID=3317327 RepID=UPI003642CD4B